MDVTGRSDVVIVGGGIAGSSLAVQLARADGAPHDQRGLHSRAGRLLEWAAEKDETSIVEIAHRIIQPHRAPRADHLTT